MPGNPHPAVAPFEDHDDQEIIAYARLHTRVQVADADEVGATDFTGQFGGLYVKTNSANYNLDTEDLSADDGVNVIYDAAGNHFVKAVDAAESTQREVTAAGAVTVSADDVDIIVINKTVGAATSVALPSADDRTKAVRIVDGKGDAATNNITISPVSGETIFAVVDYQYVIDSNGASIILTPRSDGSGWM